MYTFYINFLLVKKSIYIYRFLFRIIIIIWFSKNEVGEAINIFANYV